MRRVELYGPDHLQEWARLGGIATRNRYGNEFFREIRNKRTRYKKGYITQKTKARKRKEALQHLKTEKNWAIAELWKLSGPGVENLENFDHFCLGRIRVAKRSQHDAFYSLALSVDWTKRMLV
jgi:hypothetical protein